MKLQERIVKSLSITETPKMEDKRIQHQKKKTKKKDNFEKIFQNYGAEKQQEESYIQLLQRKRHMASVAGRQIPEIRRYCISSDNFQKFPELETW